MHRPGPIDVLVVSTSMVVVLIYIFRNLSNPPRPPRHPVPGYEPMLLHRLVRIIRRKAGAWHM